MLFIFTEYKSNWCNSQHDINAFMYDYFFPTLWTQLCILFVPGSYIDIVVHYNTLTTRYLS